MEEKHSQFEIDVLQRLSVIETLIKEQDYKGLAKIATEALSMAKNNSEEISKLQSANTWLIRTVIGAIIAAIMGFILIK